MRILLEGKPWHERLRFYLWLFWYRFTGKLEHAWGRLQYRFPRLVNEGEATARVVDMAFSGYPMPDDFASKEEAVILLQGIWDIIDNWDGSRINVAWSQGKKSNPSVYEWARMTAEQLKHK